MIGMGDEEYWALVESDPRDLTRDQKILFWWVVSLMGMMAPAGVIMAPNEAPLTTEQIKEVFEELLPIEGRSRTSEVSYMDHTWAFKNQKVIVPSSDGTLVRLYQCKISTERSN